MPKEVSKKILDATLEVIAREKISGTRMHLIAEEAHMTQSNLHYYFPTKKDLLIGLLNDIQQWFSENRQKVVDFHNGSFKENLHAIFTEKKDVIQRNKKLDYVQFDYWVQGTVDPEVRATFQRTFDTWRQDIQRILSQRTN
ncbi:MAG TPA: TetR/AcrR family transcriptional regulator, partial [Firmicutes bacterium]|nr:TetR/AcrR family transcriptional regulator [Bacillota bacterium]